MELGELIAALRRPEAWPAAGAREVGFLQTHISLLFFAGERVYKVKKPLRLPFLDYSTLERRRALCEEEVRLNRRLAPRTYLGVVPIARAPDGALVAGGRGEVVEHAVEMERLPAERMLEALLERGEVDNGMMTALAERLAAFHADAATGPGVDEHGTPEAIERLVLENLEETRRFAGDTIGAEVHALLERRSRAALEARRGLFARRVQAGRVRDGHGDLHASNVCFAPPEKGGLVIYDCIEFSARFRCGDVASDLAFLAMDLDHRGFGAFGDYLARRYAEIAADAELGDLVGFYKGYRALVRAKVASLASVGEGLDAAQRARARREASGYAQLAAAYELPPAMILMCGLPASGKTWGARHVAPYLDPVVLSSDVHRKRVAGIPLGKRHEGAYEDGLYAPEMKRRTYASLLEHALAALREGRTAVVDATFSTRAFRAPFLAAAAREGFPLLLVHVHAPEDVIRARMERRARDPHEPSDATFAVYLAARGRFEPPDEVGAERVVCFEAVDAPPEELGARVAERRARLAKG
jgi:uncharacterized protein